MNYTSVYICRMYEKKKLKRMLVVQIKKCRVKKVHKKEKSIFNINSSKLFWF